MLSVALNSTHRGYTRTHVAAEMQKINIIHGSLTEEKKNKYRRTETICQRVAFTRPSPPQPPFILIANFARNNKVKKQNLNYKRIKKKKKCNYKKLCVDNNKLLLSRTENANRSIA